MSFKELIVATLCTSSLIGARCCNFFDLGVRPGYRWDDDQYTLFSNDFPSIPVQEESFKPIHSIEIEAFTSLRLGWFTFGVNADYAWILGGGIDTMPFITALDPNGDVSSIGTAFTFDPRGDQWDALASAGVPFCLDCNCVTIGIAPIGGYSYHHQSIQRKDGSPSSSNLGAVTTTTGLMFDPTIMAVDGSKRLKRDYQGPFVGADLSVCWQHFETDFGYAYHWMNLDQDLKLTLLLTLTDPNGFLIQNNLKNNNCYKSNRNPGHRAWLALGYTCGCFRFGAVGSYLQVNAPKEPSDNVTTQTITFLNLDLPQQVTVTPSKEKVEAHWKTFSVSLEAAFVF